MNPINQFVQIVLVETSHPGNIGSVARAMKNMGLANLSLINPKKFPHQDATALAGNATDILGNAQIFESIEEATKSSKVIYATSARERSIEWPIVSAKEASEEIYQLANEEINVSILFGREDRGLTNDELQKANKHILIPSSEEYPVLNIAMSVQVIAYEIFKNSSTGIDTEWQDYPELNSEELTMLIDHFVDTSYKLNLFDQENAKKILVRIKRMFTRLKPVSYTHLTLPTNREV